ncbi:MAG: helix-turn-helix transcriptional regulator [Oricola sp.]
MSQAPPGLIDSAFRSYKLRNIHSKILELHPRMKQDAAIRIPLYSSTQIAESMIESAKTAYDLFQVLKRVGADFCLPNFIVTVASKHGLAKPAIRVALTNWDNELLQRCAEDKIFEQPLFTHPQVSVLPSTAKCSDFLVLPKFVGLYKTLTNLIVRGHDTYAHFPVHAENGVWGNITFTGGRERVTQQEMIHLEHIAGLAFVRLMCLDSDADGDNPLNKREIECLGLSGAGLSVSEVASAIDVTAHTVHYHINNAVRKLKARNKVHAIVIALEKGWLGTLS